MPTSASRVAMRSSNACADERTSLTLVKATARAGGSPSIRSSACAITLSAYVLVGLPAFPRRGRLGGVGLHRGGGDRAAAYAGHRVACPQDWRDRPRWRQAARPHE